MAKYNQQEQQFNLGISNSDKLGPKGSFAFAQNLDIYTDPASLTLNPQTIKDSGTTVQSLIKWFVSGRAYDTNLYSIDDGGRFYKRTSGGAWSLLRSVANCQGQGLELSNDYIYYTQNTQIGRYGPLSGAPAFTDNWQTGLNDTSSFAIAFAPIKAFRAGFAVGNGNQLSWWDGSVWTLDRLTFPPGFNVRSIAVVDEYLAISTWKGTFVTQSEESYIFFWDGDAVTYNFFIKLEEGAVNSMIVNQGRLFGVVGSSGSLYYLYPQLAKVDEIPKLETGKNIEVFPGAMTSYRNLVHIGVGGVVDSSTVYQGVYQRGSLNNNFPEALNFGYTISEGVAQGTNIAIGAVIGLGNNMFISWKNGINNFGVDIVSKTNNPFTTGFIDFLVSDGGDASREDLAINMKASYQALTAGQSIQLGYQTNRVGGFTMGTADTTVGSNHIRLPVDSDKARAYEFQMRTIMTTSGAVSPILRGVIGKFDDLKEEQKV